MLGATGRRRLNGAVNSPTDLPDALAAYPAWLLVLGGTLENQYRTALILNEGSHQGFIDSTVALVFFALTLLMTAFTIWLAVRVEKALPLLER